MVNQIMNIEIYKMFVWLSNSRSNQLREWKEKLETDLDECGKTDSHVNTATMYHVECLEMMVAKHAYWVAYDCLFQPHFDQ